MVNIFGEEEMAKEAKLSKFAFDLCGGWIDATA